MIRGTLAEQILWSAVAVLAVLLAVSLAAGAIDKRTIGLANVWEKPVKFQISLAIHLATIALAAQLLSQHARNGWLLLMVAIAAVAATAFEIVYIMVQAARQQASHFNLGTPFYSAMYTLMAAGAVVISVAAGITGLIVWFDKGANVSQAMRLAILLGFGIGTVLTLIAGFQIGGRLSPYVGEAAASAPRMFLTGWSLGGGDLRVPHFFATHMIQAVPLAAYVADRMLPPAGALATVWGVSIGWLLLTFATNQQAWNGKPVFSL